MISAEKIPNNVDLSTEMSLTTDLHGRLLDRNFWYPQIEVDTVPGDYAYANFIISHESGWRVTAANASGAYGLCQALPGSKMATFAGDWPYNPITQVRWGLSYITSRYGSACGAWSFWVSHHWY